MENRILRWNEPLGNSECPYAYRWVLNLGLFSVRIHKWVRSDDLRAVHDHPYSFVTLILKGSYFDRRGDGFVEQLVPGCIRFRHATYKHAVELCSGPCWTLVLTGPFVRQWGFWLNGKFLRREKYFKEYGHQCD